MNIVFSNVYLKGQPNGTTCIFQRSNNLDKREQLDGAVRHSSSLTSSTRLAFCSPALTTQLFLPHGRLTPAWESLHLPYPVPRMFLPQQMLKTCTVTFSRSYLTDAFLLWASTQLSFPGHALLPLPALYFSLAVIPYSIHFTYSLVYFLPHLIAGQLHEGTDLLLFILFTIRLL